MHRGAFDIVAVGGFGHGDHAFNGVFLDADAANRCPCRQQRTDQLEVFLAALVEVDDVVFIDEKWRFRRQFVGFFGRHPGGSHPPGDR